MELNQLLKKLGIEIQPTKKQTKFDDLVSDEVLKDVNRRIHVIYKSLIEEIFVIAEDVSSNVDEKYKDALERALVVSCLLHVKKHSSELASEITNDFV